METKVDPLDDAISSVELVNHMGDDLTVVNAARVSFAKESLEFNDQDERLVKFLARHHHWTPFAQPQIQFRIKMPIFVVREWYRHTVGLVRNEVSRRYVDTPPDFFFPKQWRGRPENGIKQGSAGTVTVRGIEYAAAVGSAVIEYNRLLEQGVAPEMARMILPQSMYTEFIETGSLYAYARICSQRDSEHAQRETAAYAQAVSGLIAPLFPVSWAALRGA